MGAIYLDVEVMTVSCTGEPATLSAGGRVRIGENWVILAWNVATYC
jgi:hypothetical protein